MVRTLRRIAGNHCGSLHDRISLVDPGIVGGIVE